jgi:hypothetical protein
VSEVIVGLLGALVGAAVAVGGQYVVRRREERERWVGLLLEDCAKIYVLEDSYTGALWEAFGDPQDPGRLEDWPPQDRALAEARLTIVCTDGELIAAVGALRDTGRAMWHAAKDGDRSEWDRLLEKHRENLARFVSRAQVAARGGHTI